MNTIFIQELLLRVQQLPGEAATLQVGLKNEVISFDFEQVFVRCPSLPQMLCRPAASVKLKNDE
jgi:hypothetical protein